MTVEEPGRLMASTESPAPRIAVIVPTFNEIANVGPLADAILKALDGIESEIIFVDDDSPDGTAAKVRELAQSNPRIRCIQRIGRRGLSSAVVEGMLAANAPVFAVLDADFQHDETLLRRMVEVIEAGEGEMVVGTRSNIGDGFSGAHRKTLSRLGGQIVDFVFGRSLSDPMSGFFAVRRDVVLAAVHSLSQRGYKILLDLVTASPKDMKVVELHYEFRERRAGESKLDSLVLLEFLNLLISKITRGLVPPRFVWFCFVGGAGLAVHLTVLTLLEAEGRTGFVTSQAIAAMTAMVFNFFLNNQFTYRDFRLRGWSLIAGLLVFAATCSIGAVANVGIARYAVIATHSWPIAGIAGALMGAVFNFGMSSKFVWGGRLSQWSTKR